MDEYVVEVEGPKLSTKQKGAMTLLRGGTYAVVMFCANWFWPTSVERRRGLPSMIIEAGLMGLFFGVAMAFVIPLGQLSYKLLIDADRITRVTQHSGRIRFPGWCTTVHRGKLRAILDLKTRSGEPRGMRLTERGRFGTWMLGAVYVPNTLPEYEWIRRLAESWLSERRSDLGG